MSEHTINNDLGTFHGYNFRKQCAIFGEFTAQEVIDWDHDEQGEAEFWPSGDDAFVSEVFKNKTAVCASELIELDNLLDSVDDSDKVKIIYAMQNLGCAVKDISSRTFDNMCLSIYEGDCFCDLEKNAAWELFELFHPQLYKAIDESPCSGVHFDPKGFLRDFSTYELEFDGSKYLIVDTQ